MANITIAHDDRCDALKRCRRPTDPDDAELVELEVLECRATRSSPEEWSVLSLHRACREAIEEAAARADDPHEAAWSKALSRGEADYS